MNSNDALRFSTPHVDELPELGALLARALRVNPEGMPEFMRDLVGGQNWRQLHRAGRRVAGLGIHRDGQYFGGRELACAGIACVGVPVEERGRGACTALLRETLEELRTEGTPLAALYASAFPVYRKVGFERAGTYTRYRLPLTPNRHRGPPLEVQLLAEDEREVVREVYAADALERAGNMVRRGEFFWQRAQGRRERPPHSVYLVREDGAPAGYVVADHGAQQGPLRVPDLRFRSPAAARRIWELLTDQATMASELVYVGAPQDPLFHVVDDARPRVEESLDWMLRLVDVDAALTGRGYPPELEVTLSLDVEDDVLPSNAGPRQVHLRSGAATLEPGGVGRARLDVRDLASLFSGFRTARELARVGSLEAPEDELARLELAFAGPRPWMPDRF